MKQATRIPRFPQSFDAIISRRAAMQVGIAGMAAITGTVAFGKTAEDDPYRGLKVGMHTYTLRKLDFEQALRVTADMGVRYIGFNPVHLPLDSSPERLAKARERVAEVGLTIMACGVIGFDGNESEGRRAFEFAKAMGMPTIAANPALESFDLLDDLVEEFGIRIAIHNHGPDSLYSTPGDVLRAVEKHHRSIGACADIGHYERSNIRAHDALRALKGRLYDMHLKDVDRPVKAGKSVPLGTGIVDFEKVFQTLLDLNFDGHVALEYEGTPDDPVEGVRTCYAYARKVLAALG